MHRSLLLAALTICGVAGLALPTLADARPSTAPTYDSSETKQLVEQMLEAHGWDRWQAAETFRFELAMYLPELSRMMPQRPAANAWRRYDVTIERATSRGYVEIPIADDERAAAAFDGESVWGAGYTPDPNIADPPLQLLYMHSSFMRMPFLTQLEGARLKDGGIDVLPGQDRQLRVVEMRFDSNGRELLFRLFVDPDTHLLQGFEHDAFYPPLPGGVPALAFPPMPEPTTIARIVEQRQTVDGVVLPLAYISVAENQAGEVRLTGTHMLQAAELDVDFEDEKAALPAGVAARLTVQ